MEAYSSVINHVHKLLQVHEHNKYIIASWHLKLIVLLYLSGEVS